MKGCARSGEGSVEPLQPDKLIPESEQEKARVAGEEALKQKGAISMEFFVKALLKEENARRESKHRIELDAGDPSNRINAGIGAQIESRNSNVI